MAQLMNVKILLIGLLMMLMALFKYFHFGIGNGSEAVGKSTTHELRNGTIKHIYLVNVY